MSPLNPQTVQQLLDWKAPPRQDVLAYGILPAGAVMFLYGEYDTRKSWLAMDMGYSIASGIPWLCYPSKQRRVLLLDGELTKEQSQDRWKAYQVGHSIQSLPSSCLYTAAGVELSIDTFQGMTELANAIQAQQAEVVILDNLYTLMAGDLNNNTAAKLFITNCRRLRTLHNPGVTFVIVHHSHQPTYDFARGKQVKLRAFEMFGSSFFTNWADTIMEVSHEIPGITDTITLTPQKYRLAPAVPPVMQFNFSRNPVGFDWLI